MAARTPVVSKPLPEMAEPEPVASEAVSASAPADEEQAGPSIGFVEALVSDAGVRDPNQVLALLEHHAKEVVSILVQRVGEGALLKHVKGSKS